jgi:diguanylate cyclase (GGDEF)-like protein
VRSKWLRHLKLALIFALVYFLVDYGLNSFAFSSGWTILWPLNGVTIALLLRRRRRDWPAILIGVAIGTGFGEMFDGNSGVSEIFQRFFSVSEVGISALLLPSFKTLDRWLRTPQIFMRFVGSLVLGPGISGVMAAVYFHQTQHLTYLLGFNNWATADAIGIAATMPLTLSIRSTEMKSLFQGRTVFRTVTILVLAMAVTAGIFSVSRYPLLFLLYPLLLYVDSVLSFPGAALAVGGVCLIAVYNSVHGWGPFGVWPEDLKVSRDVALQFFLGFHMVALFPASLLFMERRRLVETLRLNNERLQTLASFDGLTGIPNRRSLDARFQSEWRRAVRAQTPLALLMIDIDHFKQFNDIYGHQAGDQALQAVAAALGAAMRRSEDLLARFGGEEFAVLLPLTDVEGARIVAESLHAAIVAMGLAHSGSPGHSLTISIGCSGCLPTLEKDMSHLLRAADAALYRAKKEGRNRVCVSEMER